MTLLFRDPFDGPEESLPNPDIWVLSHDKDYDAGTIGFFHRDQVRLNGQGAARLRMERKPYVSDGKTYPVVCPGMDTMRGPGDLLFQYNPVNTRTIWRVKLTRGPGIWAACWRYGARWHWQEPPPLGYENWPDAREIDDFEYGLQGIDGITGTCITPGFSGTPRGYVPIVFDAFFELMTEQGTDYLAWFLNGVQFHRKTRQQIPDWGFEDEQGLIADMSAFSNFGQQAEMLVDEVRVETISVVVPAPGPIDPAPLPQPVPPVGGPMQLTATLAGRVLTFSATGTQLRSGTGFHHVEVSKSPQLGGGWYHLTSSPFTLPPGLDTVTVRLCENSLAKEHPVVAGQTYILTVGQNAPPPTAPVLKTFIAKATVPQLILTEIDAFTQEEADAKWQALVDKMVFTRIDNG